MNLKKIIIPVILAFIIPVIFIFSSSFLKASNKSQSLDFSFLIVATKNNYDPALWDKAQTIADTWLAKCKKTGRLTIDLLNDGLKLSGDLLSIACQDQSQSIQAWTLINNNPKEHEDAQKTETYLYFKFAILKKDVNQVTWDSIEQQTNDLVDYCVRSTKEEFNFDYYCDQIRSIFKKALNPTPLAPSN